MAYSAKPKASLTTEVRSLINESSPLLVSDTDIEAWEDDAVRRMTALGLMKEEYVAETLVTGTTAYTPSGIKDFSKIDSVIYVGTASSEVVCGEDIHAVTKTHPRQQGHNRDKTAGKPREWWLVGEQINIWPPPDGTVASNKTLAIYYYETQTEYDESTGKPEYFLQDYVVYYATALAFEKMGRYDAAEMYKSIFDTFIAFHRQDRQQGSADSKDTMTLRDRTRILQ